MLPEYIGIKSSNLTLIFSGIALAGTFSVVQFCEPFVEPLDEDKFPGEDEASLDEDEPASELLLPMFRKSSKPRSPQPERINAAIARIVARCIFFVLAIKASFFCPMIG
jgi:hypothetical protein